MSNTRTIAAAPLHLPEATGTALRHPVLAAAGYPLALSCHLLVWPFTQGRETGSFGQIGLALFMSLVLIAYFGRRHMGGPHHRNALNASFPMLVYFVTTVSAAVLYGDNATVFYTLFGAGYLVAVATFDISKTHILRAFCLVLYFSTLVYVFTNFDAIIQYSGGRGRVSFDNGAYSLVAYAVASSFVCALYSLVMGKRYWLIHLVMLLLSAVSVISSGTRSVFIGLTLCIILLVYLAYRQGKLRNLLTLFGGAVVVFFVLSTLPFVADRLANTFELVWRGTGQLFGVENVYEASAAGRYLNRAVAIDAFNEAPFTGVGYMYRQPDFPLLQSFQDLGLFFGLTYAVAMVIIPLTICWRVIVRGAWQFDIIVLIYILNVPRLTLHGNPYDWVTYCYVLPVYALVFTHALALMAPARASHG